ncbi:MAG: hypothetical protein WAV60_14125, partial [Anaerolineae bacterium]
MWRSFAHTMLVLTVVTLLPAAAPASPPPPGEIKARAWADFHNPLSLASPAPAHPDTMPLVEEVTPTGMGEWTRVAFQSYRDGNWEIYTAGGDGSHLTRLTNHAGSDGLPSFDRAAAQVAFASNRNENLDIFIVRADGSNLRQVTSSGDDESQPALSPQGTRIAYARDRDDNLDIYVANTDGSNSTRITYHEMPDVDPAWSPDGSKLVWVNMNGYVGSIVLADPNGANARTISAPLRYLENVTWSPDGRFLAFDYDADGDQWNEIAVMAIDGTGLHTVYDPGAALVDAWMGSWTGEGHWLAFTRTEYVIQDGRLYLSSLRLQRVPLTGGNPVAITASLLDANPDWRSFDVTPPDSAVEPLPAQTPINFYNSVTIVVSGSDGQGAGIASFDIQQRINNDPWYDLPVQPTPDANGRATVTTSVWPGTAFSFRARARDHALNVEAWPDAPDTQTVVYAMKIQGETRDARGVLLPGARVYSTDHDVPGPFAASYRSGNFDLLFATVQWRHLQARQSGYTNSPIRDFEHASIANFEFYLPGATNLVTNGGFEQGAAGWAFSGVFTPTTSYRGRSGARGARLGRPSTLQNVRVFNEIRVSWSEPLAAALDVNGEQHILYLLPVPASRVHTLYRHRPPGGNWSEPVILAQNRSTLSLTATPDGAIHAVLLIMTNGQYQLSYLRKLPNSDWSEPTPITALLPAPFEFMKLSAVATGQLRLVISCGNCPGKLLFMKQNADGSWTPPQRMLSYDPYGITGFDVTSTPTGELLAFWAEYQTATPAPGWIRMMQSSLGADGSWSPPRALWSASQTVTYFANLSLAASPTGQLVLGATVCMTGGCHVGTLHSHDWGATWAPWRFPSISQLNEPFLFDDGRGVVHAFGAIINPQVYNSSGLAHRVTTDGGDTWSAQLDHNIAFPVSAGLGDDPGQRLLLATSGAVADMALDAQPGESLLRQTISIPADMPAPTLSFLYRYGQVSTGIPDPLVLTVAGATVWTTSESADDWRHVWIDMTPSRGQTVNFTFRMAGDADHAATWAELDEVSLSGWRTPIARRVMLSGRTL